MTTTDSHRLTTEALPVEEVKVSDIQVGDAIREGNPVGGFLYWTVTAVKEERSFAGAKKWRISSKANPVGAVYGATNRVWRVIK